MANTNRNQQNYAGRSSRNYDQYEDNYNRMNREENFGDYDIDNDYPSDSYRDRQDYDFGRQSRDEYSNPYRSDYENRYTARNNEDNLNNNMQGRANWNENINDYNRGVNRGRSYGSGYLYSVQNQGENYSGGRSNWDNSYNRGGNPGYDNDQRYSNRRLNNDRGSWSDSSINNNDRRYNSQSNWGRSNDNSYGNMRRNSNEDNWEGSYNNQSRQRTSESMGPHKGKGPKGYRRSDDRIREDINDRLSDDSYLDASDIEIKVENCDVILSGTVDSRNAKRHAESLAESISGVKNVENRLRVKQENAERENRNSLSSSDSNSFLKSDNQNSKSDNNHASKRSIAN